VCLVCPRFTGVSFAKKFPSRKFQQLLLGNSKHTHKNSYLFQATVNKNQYFSSVLLFSPSLKIQAYRFWKYVLKPLCPTSVIPYCMNTLVKYATYSFIHMSLIPTLRNKLLSRVFLGITWQTLKVQARDSKYFCPLSFHRSTKPRQNINATSMKHSF
jgi:hypothetical protein